MPYPHFEDSDNYDDAREESERAKWLSKQPDYQPTDEEETEE